MLAAYTPDLLTVLSFEDAKKALEASLHATLNATPSREAVALMLAKTALETGRWRKIHCFNFGNIKAGQKWSGMYTCILLNEVLGGKVVWFAPEGQLAAGPGSSIIGTHYPTPKPGTPQTLWPFEPEQGYGHPQTRMRAYANKYDGAYDYVDFVSGGRYAPAFPFLLAGDEARWVHAIKQLGYFTADEGLYLKGVASLKHEFLAKLEGLDVEPAPVAQETFDNAALLLALHRSIIDLENVVRDERDEDLKTKDA